VTTLLRLARSRCATAVLAAGVLSLLLMACALSNATSATGPRVIPLLPAAGAAGHTWHWTPRCSLTPEGPTNCLAAGPKLGFAQLNGDAWNLGGTANTGYLAMSSNTNGTVAIHSALSQAPPCTDAGCLAPSANTWVRAYPNVLYGINQCYARTSPRVSPDLPLPLQLASLPQPLIGTTAYSTDASNVTSDVTYDLWLNTTGTKDPCRTKGTLEILVVTDYDARALLPASLEIGQASVPATVGATARPLKGPWTVYASNVGSNGWTASWGGTLWFVASPTDRVHRGRVSVDLSAVLKSVDRILQDTYHWSSLAHQYWLDTVSFGIEFGPRSADPYDSGPAVFSARISAFCLTARGTLTHPACG
jgi:Glycosyl hydrolase family 12